MRLRVRQALLLALASMGGVIGAQDDPPAAAPAPLDAQPAWSEEERAAIELLRSLRKKERPADSELAVSLSQAGERMLRLYFEVLATRSVPALQTGKPQILSEVQENVIMLALAQLERDPVLAHVGAALSAGVDPKRRHAAIGCIGAIGRANDLPQLFELSFAPDETTPDERLLGALRRAVASLLVRDPRTVEQLVSLRRITRPELLSTLVDAVGVARDPRGLLFLSEVVYWHEGLILAVMSQIPLLGISGDEAVDGPMRVRVRPYLDASRPGPCRAAIVALTSLEDVDSIGTLIELLGTDDSGLRENAQWALKQLTGLSLSAGPEAWARWHQGELYWLVREKPREFQRLREKDPAVVADALRTILTHPLARTELASALPDLLQSRWPAMRVLACRTLAELEARDAVGRLVWALEDPEPEVAQAAHAALQKLTRLDLPREPIAWQTATNTEPRGTEL